jgi:hypothetical protein
MKKHLFLMLIAAAALMFAGCDKKDADDELTPGVNEEIKDAPPHAASKKAWVFGDQTWSDAIHIPACNKGNFIESNTSPDCRSLAGWHYYNWPYVNANATTLCPSPWRVPTVTDFTTLVSNTTDAALINAWGYGGRANGSDMEYVTSYAFYWSSTENGNLAYNLLYYSGYLVAGGNYKDVGLQVRCVK